MLKGMAKDQYYSNALSRVDFLNATNAIRNFFEGVGYHQRALAKWNDTSLSTIISANPEKPTHECIKLLVTKLRALKYALSPDLQTDSFFHAALVRACSGVPACRVAVICPPPTIGGLINILQSAAMNYDQERKASAATFVGDNGDHESYYTDRQYRRNPTSSQGRGAYQGPRRRYIPNDNNRDGKPNRPRATRQTSLQSQRATMPYNASSTEIDSKSRSWSGWRGGRWAERKRGEIERERFGPPSKWPQCLQLERSSTNEKAPKMAWHPHR
jgi:hypothetical protein